MHSTEEVNKHVFQFGFDNKFNSWAKKIETIVLKYKKVQYIFGFDTDL